MRPGIVRPVRAPFPDRFRRRPLPQRPPGSNGQLERVKELHFSEATPPMPDVPDAPAHALVAAMARDASKRNYATAFRDGVEETLARLAPFAERDPELARFVDEVRLRTVCEHVWTYSPSREITVCATCGVAAIDIQTGLGGR